MADDPERPGTCAGTPMTNLAGRNSAEKRDASSPSGGDQQLQTISLLEETALISKRRVVTGSIRIETRTEIRQESASVELDRRVIDVTRVPVDRLIEDTPDVRTEGDTTIVPVVEERFVVVKQLFLKEELHIRHRTERETFPHSVALRRQYAVVERFDPEGRLIDPGKGTAPRSKASSTNGS